MQHQVYNCNSANAPSNLVTFGLLVSILIVAICSVSAAAVADSRPFGYFPNAPQLEWLDDGRDMQLLRPFEYIYQHQVTWIAPKAAIVDGASIPKILWSFVGGPYEGKYRNASIIHDTECKAQSHEWRLVHRMFYNGSRAGGVGWIRAQLMYAAVYYFGPRWKVKDKVPVVILPSQAKEYLIRTVVLMRRNNSPFAVTERFSLDKIESLSYSDLIREVPDNDPDLATVRR